MTIHRLEFVPSRVEGMPAVSSITVHPDRIEVTSAGRVVTHRFVNIAQWPRPRLMWKLLYRIGVKPRWLCVADRDWFHEPADMFFEFYTMPRLKVYMPLDENKDDHDGSYFGRLQRVLRHGGFRTFDLG